MAEYFNILMRIPGKDITREAEEELMNDICDMVVHRFGRRCEGWSTYTYYASGKKEDNKDVGFN